MVRKGIFGYEMDMVRNDYNSVRKMRFVQFEDSGNRRVGVELKENGDIVDLCKGNAAIPKDMRSFIQGGNAMLAAAKG